MTVWDVIFTSQPLAQASPTGRRFSLTRAERRSGWSLERFCLSSRRRGKNFFLGALPAPAPPFLRLIPGRPAASEQSWRMALACARGARASRRGAGSVPLASGRAAGDGEEKALFSRSFQETAGLPEEGEVGLVEGFRFVGVGVQDAQDQIFQTTKKPAIPRHGAAQASPLRAGRASGLMGGFGQQAEQASRKALQ